MKKIIVTKDNIEEIVAKNCDGLADNFEIEALTVWRTSSKANENWYQELLKTNAYYAQMKDQPVDVDLAWNNVRSKMSEDKPSIEEGSKPTKTNRRIWSIMSFAASIVLIVAVGLLMRNSSSDAQLITTDIAMSHNLDDGSVIHLGQNSALNKISKTERAYNFSGEAEFDIVHDDTKPFVIHMNKIIVKDLGTVFNIKSIPMNDTVFVKVTEGLAQFYTLSDSGIILEQGEEGMYIKSKNKFYKRSSDVKNQFLSITFENATLGEVIDHLSYSFRKEISIQNESLKNCNLTVDFSKASLSVVKEIIEETLNVDIKDSHASLMIEGEGCE